MPKGNMFKRIDDNTIEIKYYHNSDWVWIKCQLRSQDVKYIHANCISLKEMAPTLKRKGKHYVLQCSYEKKVNFKDLKPVVDSKVLSVDLGVNTSAVCSVVNANGTVLSRKFINPHREKDCMYTLINRIAARQRTSGKEAKITKLFGKVNNLKQEITNKVSHEIITFALEQDVDVIVFEHLGRMKLTGYGAKRNKRKVHHWNKCTIIDKVCQKAHFYGIRYAKINPRNTSKLAFDGSGEVTRFDNNFSLCKFKTGKIYHCDLSASYNIGARYFIRELQKTTSESAWLEAEAKVPSLSRRTQTTLASLISLTKVLKAA